MTLPRILLLFAVTLLLGTGAATAAPSAPLADVVATLEQGYASLKDLQASFTQRTEMAAVKRSQTGSGELFIRKGAGDRALFRFNYVKPSQQIVSNGKTVWYYLPENRQVMTMDASALFAGGGGVALSYLTGIGQISRDFAVSFAGNGRDAKGNHVLDLVPKKNRARPLPGSSSPFRPRRSKSTNGRAKPRYPFPSFHLLWLTRWGAARPSNSRKYG